MGWATTRKSALDNIKSQLDTLLVPTGNFKSIAREEKPEGWLAANDFPLLFMEYDHDSAQIDEDTFVGDAWDAVYNLYVITNLGQAADGSFVFTEAKQEEMFDRTGEVLNRLSTKTTIDAIAETHIWFNVHFDRVRFGFPTMRIELHCLYGPEPN